MSLMKVTTIFEWELCNFLTNPCLIDARLLKTRTSVEVCAALERMTSFFESISFAGFEITDSPRIKRLHSDRAREFTVLYFQKF